MMKTKQHTQFTIAILCGVLSMSALATTGIVSDKSGDYAVRVPAGDLNLSNKIGAETLYQRMKSAARQICGPQEYRTTGSLARSRMNLQCYQQALDSAVNKVDNEQLTEIHTS
jgi:UrcA family protein